MLDPVPCTQVLDPSPLKELESKAKSMMKELQEHMHSVQASLKTVASNYRSGDQAEHLLCLRVTYLNRQTTALRKLLELERHEHEKTRAELAITRGKLLEQVQLNKRSRTDEFSTGISVEKNSQSEARDLSTTNQIPSRVTAGETTTNLVDKLSKYPPDSTTDISNTYIHVPSLRNVPELALSRGVIPYGVNNIPRLIQEQINHMFVDQLQVNVPRSTRWGPPASTSQVQELAVEQESTSEV